MPWIRIRARSSWVFWCLGVSPRVLRRSAPDGSARAAENMPVGFCDVDAGWALVVWGAFDSMHVSASGQMAVGKFCNADLGAVLESIERLHRDFPVDGLEGVLGPVILLH